MKGFVQVVDRQQTTLLPECLDDWVDESDPVRAVDASTWIAPGCMQFLGEEKRFHTAWVKS